MITRRSMLRGQDGRPVLRQELRPRLRILCRSATAKQYCSSSSTGGAPFCDIIRDCFGGSPCAASGCRKLHVGLGVDFADFNKAAAQILATVA
jgi:hypothetical protein